MNHMSMKWVPFIYYLFYYSTTRFALWWCVRAHVFPVVASWYRLLWSWWSCASFTTRPAPNRHFVSHKHVVARWAFNATFSTPHPCPSSLQLLGRNSFLPSCTSSDFYGQQLFRREMEMLPQSPRLCFFFPDGDGKWGLAGGRRPAGAGQDLLEGRTGSVPADAHRAQTEVQGDERRYELSLLRRLSANVLWEFLEN